MTYQETIQKTYKLLDMIDIKSYCNYDLDVQQVMRRIEGDYYNASQSADPKVLKYMEENVDFFQWYVFNWIDEFEFIEYCKVRYPEIKWRTEVIEKTYIYDMG